MSNRNHAPHPTSVTADRAAAARFNLTATVAAVAPGELDKLVNAVGSELAATLRAWTMHAGKQPPLETVAEHLRGFRTSLLLGFSQSPDLVTRAEAALAFCAGPDGERGYILPARLQAFLNCEKATKSDVGTMRDLIKGLAHIGIVWSLDGSDILLDTTALVPSALVVLAQQVHSNAPGALSQPNVHRWMLNDETRSDFRPGGRTPYKVESAAA